MGIVTLIPEALAKSRPTEPLRLSKRATTRSAYGNWKEDNGVRPICVYLTIMTYLISSCHIQSTVRLRSTCGGHSVCERSVCMMS